MNFDYFYGEEGEQFSFYRIPKALVKNSQYKTVSMEAKFLYGLMLDRMSLSMKNRWLDIENRVYIIYTLEEIKEDMNCGNEKGVKTVAELEKIGLIERKKQGQGKPALIYIKNFVKNLKENEEAAEVKTSEKPKSENLSAKTQDFRKTEVKTSENQNSRLPKNQSQDFRKSECNKTNYNDNYINNNIYNNQSINQSNNINIPDEKPIDVMDTIDSADVTAYAELIKENIEYDTYTEIYKNDNAALELYKELYSIICDIVCVKRNSVRIGRQEYPYELVKARFLELNGSHLEYVVECIKNIKGSIGNIKAYLLTTLYNSVDTIQSYYLQKQNAATEKQQTVTKAKNDSFLNYKQRTWNFEELRKLEREYNMIS